MKNNDVKVMIKKVTDGSSVGDVFGKYLDKDDKTSNEEIVEEKVDIKEDDLFSSEPRLELIQVDTRDYFLSYLRPKDIFAFISETPCSDVSLETDYEVIPASRGYLSFCDKVLEEVYTFSMEDAMKFSVNLISCRAVPLDRRFYPGDRVRIRDGGRATILGPRNGGFVIRLDNESKIIWKAGATLLLIDKYQTTKGYIIVDNDGNWVVTSGDYRTLHSTELSALKDLLKTNRAGFNRWSRMKKESFFRDTNTEVISKDIISYLCQVDPGEWDNNDKKVKQYLENE